MPADVTKTKGSLKQKIADFVEDIATLDVLTLTGEIKLLGADETKPVGELKDLFQNVVKNMSAAKTNELQVVAYTHVEFDYDTVLYADKNASAALLEAHKDAVESAQTGRSEAVKTATEIVKSIF